MKNLAKFLIATALILILSSCASILSKSTYPFTINTTPSGVNVLIKNGEGMDIYNGTSPATVNLKAGAGFFKKASYIVRISGEGYNEQTLPINFTIDGWYFGNLLLGGVIGMLIVDPATGAMYKIEDEYMNINLSKSSTSIENPTFKVYDIANTPKEWKDKLVKITQ
jgi:hypothetical protein